MICAQLSDRELVDDLTQEFLAESSEGLDRMERCLTELEQRPEDAALIGEIFRAVHTIKGTTGFLGFGRLERLAHAGETLLGALRDGRLRADAELVNGLLRLMDGLRAIVDTIAQAGHEGTRRDDDDSELFTLMDHLQGSATGAKTPVAVPIPAFDRQRPAAPTGAPIRLEAAATQPATPAHQPIADRTLRMDVDVLNRMMNLVGELVLTRNQLLQSSVDAANFPQLSRRLDAVTADLRETVMQARMQPVGYLFGKFPRMVRDLAQSCGKRVRIEFFGEGTALDRSLLEAIKDPLTHAVRNAVDHGIETPAERLAAGKAAEGVVTLTAYHQSGWVVVELSDDGAGIARSKVLAKALDRGLITAERAADMTPREVLDLIFLPGFSTASAVTTVSGRGVGMDVVRANVEGVGGAVEMESEEGQGTQLRLRVPLTMAIIPALVVRSGGQSFCLPQGALAELVYVPHREANGAIERMGDAELFRLRDQLLPMIWLDRLLEIAARTESQAGPEAHGFYVAVLEADGSRFGLVVDDLMAPEEIVVKPLSPVLREVGLFSGATVLGNGTLAMILDVAATAARARVRPLTRQSSPQAGSVSGASKRSVRQTSFLIYETEPQCLEATRPSGALLIERHALPLESVERIETISVSQVERAGGQLLVQHRGCLLPLEDEGHLLRWAADTGGDAQVTVLICEQPAHFAGPSRRVGLVVSRVVDIADGKMLEDNIDLALERLAMVKDKVAVLHSGFVSLASNETRPSLDPVTLKEVA